MNQKRKLISITNCIKRLLAITTVLIICNQCLANQIKPSFSLNGVWKVRGYRFLLHVNIEDKRLLIQDKRDQQKCLNSEFIISGNSMKIIPKGGCNFTSCNSLNLSGIKEFHKLPDSLYFKYPGEELVRYGMVSQDFLDLIRAKENKIQYIDTNCFCENGDYTLKIIIINSHRIVLFSGVDITILERIQTKTR